MAITTLALASLPAVAADWSHAGGVRRAAFAVIEQPLGVKLGAIAGGMALASLELWWFLGGDRENE